MDLPNLLTKLKPQQEDARKFVAIEISGSAVKTAVWQVVRHHTEVVTVGSTQAWETESASDLIEAVKTSLAAAFAGIEPVPQEVIFGLPETWVGETSIAQNKKPLIKNLCQAADLSPVGFVVTTQAIIHYLRDLEGGPPSGILINVAPDQVIVSLVYLGQLEGAQVVGRSGQIAADVEEGLARFPQKDTIPSRMIIYDSHENLDDLKQELISYDWQSRLPFLHIPKVESLPKDATIKAVAIAGGVEVARALGLTGLDVGVTPVTETNSPPTNSTKKDFPPTSESDHGALKVGDEVDDTSPDPTDEFGFTTIEITTDTAPTLSEDISPETKSDPSAPVPPQSDSLHEKMPDSITSKTPIKEKVSKPEPEPELIPTEDIALSPKSPPSVSSQPKHPGLSLNFTKLFQSIHLPKFPAPSLSKFPIPPLLIIGIVLLLLVGSGAFAAYWYLPKASVTVFLAPKPIPQEVTFKLDPDATEPNLNSETLPAQVETVEVSGSDETSTTGSKTVGEPARGKVAIYNRTSSSKTLTTGTNLTANDLQFTLDDDVNIASASTTENPDFSLTTQPSKAEVNITATNIGSQYNLGVDSQFSVANFSSESFVGRAITDLSGGSSREVQVVSPDDLERLNQELLDQLQEQATAKLTEQTGSKQGVVYANDYKTLDQSQSHKVGEEATSVSLNLTVAQTAYIYNIKDISLLAQQRMLENLPENYVIQAEETTIEVLENSLEEDGSISITALATLKLMPMVSAQEVAQNIAGKYPLATESYFKSLPDFVRTETEITPSLPARLNTFPRQPSNITVEIKPAPNR